MDSQEIVSVTLTGNGGQAFFDMAPEDAKSLQKLLKSGTQEKSFSFKDPRSKSQIIVSLEKLFIMEIQS